MNQKRLKQLQTLQKLKAQEKQRQLPEFQKAQATLLACQTRVTELVNARDVAQEGIIQTLQSVLHPLTPTNEPLPLPQSLEQSHHHLQWLERAILQASTEIALAQEKVDTLKEPLLQLSKEEKQLETLQEKIHEAYRLEEERKETLLLEEFSLRAFLQHPKEC
ncbi:MAG: flagellar export protein FliJ [Vampirovibrionales bacterium]